MTDNSNLPFAPENTENDPFDMIDEAIVDVDEGIIKSHDQIKIVLSDRFSSFDNPVRIWSVNTGDFAILSLFFLMAMQF